MSEFEKRKENKMGTMPITDLSIQPAILNIFSYHQIKSF